MAANQNFNAQQEHLHRNYAGTGHADISKYEWLTNQHRDTISSHLGHHSMPMFLAVAKGESIGELRTTGARHTHASH
jgi:splicing factor 3B subunit 5